MSNTTVSIHKPWLNYVLKGELSKAYDIFFKSSYLNLYLKLPSFKLVAILLFKYIKIFSKLPLNQEDNAIDIDSEFILFWKKPNHVGMRLAIKILIFIAKKKQFPARAISWYAHWLGFQGEYKKSLILFSFLIKKVKKNNRLGGEISSFYGNFLYSVGKYDLSLKYHKLAQEILSFEGDNFFQMFDLGTSSKTFMMECSLENFKKNILEKYDHLNPDNPDKRYGMRVLIYTAFLHFIENNDILGNLYYNSALGVYKESSSPIDKTAFSIYCSLIAFHNRDLFKAKEWCYLAKTHLKEFGTYKAYEYQIEELESFFSGLVESPKNPLLKKIQKTNKSFGASGNLNEWYKRFLTIYYSLTKSDDEKSIIDYLRDLTYSSEITVSKTKLDTISIIEKLDFNINEFDNNTVLEFEIILTNKLIKIKSITSIKKWRNKEIFEAIESSIHLYQDICIKNWNDKYLVNQEKLKNKQKVNQQIAHDIRSPLEALKSITTNLDSLDYNTKRIVSNSIGRISDIANGLLKSGNEKNEGMAVGNLRILLDDIVHDKSFEHNIEIKYEANVEYRSSYILGNESTLYRSLSNLVNNAVEAQIGKNKYVNVTLVERGNELVVAIEDHGPGMNDELIQKVLHGGHTTKENGNGLGLSYAKSIVEEHGGRLVINSRLGSGTLIELVFPKAETPTWFVDEFKVNKETTSIVCIDDDLSFLELYKEKFKTTDKQVIAFTSPELAKFIDDKNIQFFFDYDLGKDKTGLDLIIEYNLAERSTLITSMHQDETIQKKCIDLGLKMMPKQIFNNSSVKIVESHKRVVFIDDDKLMHMSWQMEADKVGVELNTYFSINEFLLESNQYDKKVKIFIDSSLGDGIKGEVDGEEIYKLGFKNIFLATGYSPEDIDKPDWIVKIVGKRPDFK